MKNVQSTLNNLKFNIDQLDVDKTVSVLIDSSKLSDVVKNHVVKKDVYNAKIKNIEDKILHITNLSTDTVLDAKMKLKNK